jgi:predicted outer membrane repeat protein
MQNGKNDGPVNPKGGGAIHLNYDGAKLTIYSCTFIGNVADWGGAIGLDGGVNVAIFASTFILNVARRGGGGAIFIISNTAAFANITIKNVTFDGNHAASQFGVGGAIYVYDGAVKIHDSDFRNNTASEAGGAVYVDRNTNITFTGGHFTNNSISPGQNDITRYAATSTVTFVCAADEEGASVVMQGADLLSPPPPDLKCIRPSSSYLCHISTHTCIPAPGGDSHEVCKSGCGGPPDVQRRIQERQAIEAFANATTSAATDGWVHSCQDGWKGNLTDVCERNGVTCDPPSTGYITKIDLSACGLTGTIPSNSIFTLRGLKEIHLRSEEYKGNSGLQGSLPSDLSLCSSLEVIDFNSNNLEGSVPSLFLLTNLKNIDMHYNMLSGTLPSIASPTINYISFAGNSFTGTIPSKWSALSDLKTTGQQQAEWDRGHHHQVPQTECGIPSQKLLHR